VYHNIVPVISYRLKGNAPQIRTAILAGSGIPLLLFLVWNAVVLGNVGPALLNAAGGVDPIALLRRGGAGDGAALPTLISAFSEAAVITSFTGFVYGCVCVCGGGGGGVEVLID
jgi:tyrosine-specific transport protein